MNFQVRFILGKMNLITHADNVVKQDLVSLTNTLKTIEDSKHILHKI
jgi:hypothetical protein